MSIDSLRAAEAPGSGRLRGAPPPGPPGFRLGVHISIETTSDLRLRRVLLGGAFGAASDAF